MSVDILPKLASQLVNANRIVETIVVRTRENAVFTIDIGESLLAESGDKYGAKVTLVANPPQHLGVCYGANIESVRTLAQELISQAMDETTQGPAVPPPKMKMMGRKITS